MLDEDGIRFACDDARQRNKATVELIQEGDRRALELLKFYIAVATAAISAAAAIFYSVNGSIPLLYGVALSGLVLPLLAASVCCFMVIRGADINLPGRDAEFWQWALAPNVNSKDAYEAYLAELAKGQAVNRSLNARMSKWMDRAKILGMISPLGGLLFLYFGIAARI